jgi:hypothetical protein
MAATFAGLIAAPDRDLVVLAELTPALQLNNWTSLSPTFANSYGITVSRFYQSSLFPGGVYRKVVGVRVDGVDLTERASQTLVNSNAQSWFWDPSTGVITVRLTGSVSPDTKTMTMAFTTIYTATRGIVLDLTDGDASTGVYYHPWLASIPGISQYIEDLIFGSKISEGGRGRWSNTHGYFHQAAADYAWKNKRVRLYLGGSYSGGTLLRSQYASLTSLRVDDMKVNEEIFETDLKPLPKLLDGSLPITPYFESAYANLGEGVRGTLKWIGYGRAIVRPDLTDTTVSQGRWTVADAAYQTLFAVNAVYAVDKKTKVRTLLTLTTDYTVDLTACTVTVVNATYNWTNYDIDVDATGKPDGLGGYLKTFSAIVKDVLTSFVGALAADIDTAAFTAAAGAATQELHMWVKSPRTISSILASSSRTEPSLERSVLGRLNQTVDGRWTVTIFEPSYDAATVPRMRKEDFTRFEPEPRLESLRYATRVFYNHNHAQNTWSTREAVDLATKYLNESNDTDDAKLYTYLTQQSDADTLAQRFQLLTGGGPVEIEFEERGTLLADRLAGDKVLVTYSPAPYAGGSITERAFEIIRIDRALAPSLKITGRFGDMMGLADTVGRWTSSTAPTWAAASASERAEQGFWSNSSGYIDPADTSTLNLSRWW